MPKRVYNAYGYVRKVPELTNSAAGRLPQWKACRRGHRRTLDDHFPLYVWQTGTGTQSKVNVNEVLSNLGHGLNGS
jgi:fumarate hydratase class II